MSATHQTKAAKESAPPKKRHNGIALLGFGLVVPLFTLGYHLVMARYDLGEAAIVPQIVGVVLGVVFLVAGAIIAPRDGRYNSQVFPEELEQWNRTWACGRCGTRFIV
jgi:hypothetical protein